MAPDPSLLFRGETVQFTATVSGTSQTDVTWSASCGAGTPAGGTFDYVAPTTAGEMCTVTATSDLDPSMAGSIDVTVRNELLVTATDDVDDGTCDFGHCSLHEALDAANAEAGADTIYLDVAAAPAPTSGQGAPVGPPTVETMTMEGTLPTITTAVTIIGEGAAVTTVDLNGTGPLSVQGDLDLLLRGFTVRNGVAALGTGGGGLRVEGGARLVAEDVHLLGNRAAAGAGGVGGGGLLLQGVGTTGELTDVVVDDNVAEGGLSGGGVLVRLDAALSTTGGSVSGNTGDTGGGFDVTDGSSVTLDGTVIDGNEATGTTLFGNGGGIHANASATVTATDVMITNNTAVSGGGALFWDDAVVSISGSEISDNESFGLGGGLNVGAATDLTLTQTTISGNSTGVNAAGGLLLQGTATGALVDVTITANTAADGGGGLVLIGSASGTLTDSDITQNTAVNAGGGVWVSNSASLTMTGGVIDGNVGGQAGGGFLAQGDGQVDFDGVIVSDNTSGTDFVGGGGWIDGTFAFTAVDSEFRENTGGLGGGMAFTGGTSVLTRVVIEDNQAVTGNGGGVYADGAGTLTITDSDVLANDGTNGGGLFMNGFDATLTRVTVFGNAASNNGGGMTAIGTVTVEASTVSGNSAVGRGGGISSSGATVINSTISGNNASDGGGLVAFSAGTLTNVSLVANTASNSGAGILAFTSGAPTLVNTLLALNTVGAMAQNCAEEGAGQIGSGDGNLSDDASCDGLVSAADQSDVAAGVASALADNGGSTLTHALLEGSAAIDAAVGANCPAADQRGAARVGTCDVGAFEFGSTAPGG